MVKFLGGLFDSNEKELKRLQPYVDGVNELEPDFEEFTDEELKAKTAELKARIAGYTSDIKPKLEAARQELDEAKQHQTKAAWDIERDEADKQCKRVSDYAAEIGVFFFKNWLK